LIDAEISERMGDRCGGREKQRAEGGENRSLKPIWHSLAVTSDLP
jgi:hypothetical protein